MPTFDAHTGERADAVGVSVEVDVRGVIVRHAEVSLLDAYGREAILIQRPTHPGAGLDVQFADHVEVGDDG